MDPLSFNRITSYYQCILAWMQRVHFTRRLGYVLVFMAMVLGVLTYLALTRDASLGLKSQDIVLLLNLDLGILLLLCILVAKRLVELWAHRKQGLAGSKLHVRLVVLLSVLTVIPTIVMALLSGLFLNAGLQSWFSTRVQTALSQSSAVAEAYLEEHKEVIRANVDGFRRDISDNLIMLTRNREIFDAFINRQAELRNLSEAIVFDTTPEVLARSRLTFALEFEFVNSSDLERSAREVVVLTSDQRDRVRALVQVDPELDIYLLVGRIVDAQVLRRIDDTENALSEYRQLESNLSDLKLKFVLIFGIIALLLLIISIWFGLSYATHLALPISRLLEATEKLRKGDLSVRVKTDTEISDLSMLSIAFNRMAKWIQKQQEDLIQANEDIDQRRRLIEAVLSGVSAGVIGLDKKKGVNLANRSASELLSINFSQHHHKPFTKIVPEMAKIFEEAQGQTFCQTQIIITREGHNRTFLVRLVEEQGETEMEGYIITFDDVTNLIEAQRSAAWSDMARRIAHEIKNPLTPIQLSAERLKRKYLSQIQDDPATFEKCIETISRQVDQLGKMVSEFSSFARMPPSSMEKIDILPICHRVVEFESQAHPMIKMQCRSSLKELTLFCDGHQIEQALLNLIQNAADSVEARLSQNPSSQKGLVFPKGQIFVDVSILENQALLKIIDTGLGFPLKGRERLIDPYVSHKEKGTGLGLAIVKRIIEDHNGVIRLEDNPDGLGAKVTVEIPLQPKKIEK